MLLVLAHRGDDVADWTARALADRGRAVERVTGAELVGARRWSLRQEGGRTRCRAVLADGRELAGERIGGVVNRLTGLPPGAVAGFDEEDRGYAAREWTAGLLAWLDGLDAPVVNPPTAGWLAGPALHPAAWSRHAARAGLPLARARWRPGDGIPGGPGARDGPAPAVVVGGEVAGGGLPGTCRRGAVVLADRVGCPVLQVEFVAGEDGPRFAGATPRADLRRAGAAGIDRLDGLLSG